MMAMHYRGWWSCVCLSLASCGGSDYAAALLLDIDGAIATPGGGYVVELRHPDGGALTETSEVYVPYAAGRQQVSLVLERDTAFDDAQRLDVRVYVQALPSRSASPVGLGSVLAALRRGEVTKKSVSLIGTPTGADDFIAASFSTQVDETPGQAITLQWAAGTQAWPGTLHLWAIVPTAAPVWQMQLDDPGTTVVTPTPGVSWWSVDGLRLRVTLESTDSAGPLVRSSGWTLYEGGPAATVAAAELELAPLVSSLLSLLGATRDHAAFARSDALGGNVAGARGHAEHVHNAVAGPDNAPGDAGDAFDLTGNGDVQWASADHTGVGVYTGAGGDYGYVAEIMTRVITLAESVGTSLGQDNAYAELMSCQTQLVSTAGDVKNAALLLVGEPSLANADTLLARADALRGDAFDAALVAAHDGRQSALCLRDRIETLGIFALTAP